MIFQKRNVVYSACKLKQIDRQTFLLYSTNRTTQHTSTMYMSMYCTLYRAIFLVYVYLYLWSRLDNLYSSHSLIIVSIIVFLSFIPSLFAFLATSIYSIPYSFSFAMRSISMEIKHSYF